MYIYMKNRGSEGFNEECGTEQPHIGFKSCAFIHVTGAKDGKCLFTG
jgi:hypothetical protein